VPEPLRAGTLARWPPPPAGPLGTARARWLETGASPPASDLPIVMHPWLAVALDTPDAEMRPSSTPTGRVRIARREESDDNYRRLKLDEEVAAREAAQRLAEHPAAARQLRELGGLHAVDLATWTAGQLQSGALKILWRRREPLTEAVEPAAPPPPPTRRPAAPGPSSPPTPAYSTFPPGIDAAAVAQVLKAAAQDGVPFCEECMKADTNSNTEATGTD